MKKTNLSRHNQLTYKKITERTHYLSDDWIATNIACDYCGAILLENIRIIYTSSPPQKMYHCPKCEWTGAGF